MNLDSPRVRYPLVTGQLWVFFINFLFIRNSSSSIHEMKSLKMKKFDLSKVEFSNNDLKLGIKVPEYLTEDLAYFLGFHVGDGYMQIKRRENKTTDYRLQYAGHHINDYLFYIYFLGPLVKKLFNKEVKVNVIGGIVTFVIRSKAIVSFLNKSCGLPPSPKKYIGVLPIIKFSNNNIKASFLRGVADTDFSLVFRKGGKYPVIIHATYSEVLHKSLGILLHDLNLYFYYYSRFCGEDKKFRTYEIYIYGRKNLQDWINCVGFYSYNHLTKYLVWKETGFLRPYTNINDRIEILKEKGIKYSIPLLRLGSDSNRQPRG